MAWWDWRGWSDWFYGGQALGVNYPPLGLLWLRWTDPLHGQFAAVAVGLLVLLPWAMRSMARALGVRTSPGTWAVLAALVVFAGNAHWLLPGFHSVSTGFGSWPAMIASLLGVVCVARAVEVPRPVSTGLLAGVSVLFNSTVIPGVALMVLAVLAGGVAAERRRVREAARWAVTVLSVGVAVCAWWLVPFLHGWSRLVRWRVPLREAFHAADNQTLLVVLLLVGVLVCAAVLGRRGRAAGVAVLVVVLAAGAADWLGYLRAERWVTPAVVVAMVLCALGLPRLRLRTTAGEDGGGRADQPANSALGAAAESPGPGGVTMAGPEGDHARRGTAVGDGPDPEAAAQPSTSGVTSTGPGTGPGEAHAGHGTAVGSVEGSPVGPDRSEPPKLLAASGRRHAPGPAAGSTGGGQLAARSHGGPAGGVEAPSVGSPGSESPAAPTAVSGDGPAPRSAADPAGDSLLAERALGSGRRFGRFVLAAAGVAAAVLAGVWAAVPVVVWALWRRRWAIVRYGAPAWAALLIAVPAASLFSPPERSEAAPAAAMTLTARADENNAGGFVYLQESFEHARGGVGNCGWGDPWALVASTDTKLRPLTGLYRETSASSEFIAVAETSRQGAAQVYGEPMDQWAPAWAAAPAGTPINHETAAGALGASWYVFCDSTDTITTRRLDTRRASGVALAPHATNDAWHRDAVGWWAGLLTGEYALQDAEAAVPTHGEVDWDAYPPAQAAGGVSVLEAGESFAVTAETAGWVWIRVPWDPYWHSHNNTPVLKGGPGHIIAWVNPGNNGFGWWVPPQVDTAAIITTAGAAALAITLLITGRRRPQSPDLPSRRPTGRQSDKI